MTHRQRNLTILGIAAVFLLLAIGLEHPYFSSPDGNWSSVVFNIKSLIALLKELAFALLIALMISVGIEAQSRKSDNEAADALRKRIAEDVFEGVFSRALPKNYVDLVIGIHLKPATIRRSMSIYASIEPIPPEFGLDIKQSRKSVLYRARSIYKIENISPYKTAAKIAPYCPASFFNEIEDKIGITSFNIKRLHSKSITVLADVRRERREGSFFYDYDLDLDANESVEVEIEMLSIKDYSDNHIWATTDPVLGLDFDLIVKTPGILVGVTPRTSTPMEAIFRSEDPLIGKWRSNGPILRNDTITVWWVDAKSVE